ncbi:hypothetical protein LCGC14_0282630 [marine sediment metagenome]|uniref:Uncharacterized protein n=1 Tax=marine sediment metagenome TaxID=412755 RepID=A0A0F9U0J6_9ZZZZ
MKAAVNKVRLSPNMRYVLEGIVAGKDLYHSCDGRSEYGGRAQTLDGLRRRGLLDADGNVTESAKALFKVVD